MAAARTQTTKDGEDNKLILYRIAQLEGAVKDVGTKVDKLDNIKASDLDKLANSIISRITDVRTDLQEQINELKANKAEKSQVEDLRGLARNAGLFFLSIIGSLVVFYITNKP